MRGYRHARLGQRIFLLSLSCLLLIPTSAFLSGNVLAESGQFSPPYSDYGKDTDGDSFYNKLILNASIDITAGGSFYVYGGLYDSGFTTLITEYTVPKSLSAGSAVVPLELDGIDIYNSAIDGPYGVWLILYDGGFNVLDTDSAQSSSYSYTEFQHNPAEFNPPHYDYGLDINGNTLYNYLVAMVNITVSASGTYRIDGGLYDGSGVEWIADDSNQSFFSVGDHMIELRIDGFKIRKKPINGPYKLFLDLKKDGTQLIDEDTHMTQSYLSTDFEGSAAYFSGPSTDAGVDLNGNVLYEYLKVSVGVTVNVSGDYEIVADLWDDANPFPNYITATSNSTHLSLGTGTVDIYFLGSEIYKAGINSKYVAELEMRDSESTIQDRWMHITPSYNYDQFEPDPPATLSPPHSDHGLDTEPDGLFNYLVVDLSVNAAAAGGYRFNASLYDSTHSTFITGGEEFAVLATGIQTVPLYFNGWAIYNSSIDGSYNLTVRIYDIFGNFLRRGYYDTSSYLHTDFQHIVGDTTPPTISLTQAQPSPQEVYGNVNITARIEDNLGVIQIAKVEITDPAMGLAGNFTMNYHAGANKYFFLKPYDMLGAYSFIIWASDPDGNWATDSGFFVIEDTTLPSISNVGATSPQEVHGSVNITATIIDNYQLSEAWVEVVDPGSSVVGNYSMALDGVSGEHFFERTYSQLGVYTFTIWAKDSSDNWNSASGMFTIEDSTVPTIQGVTANPSPQLLHGFVNISAIITDNFGLQTVTIQVTNPSPSVIFNGPMDYDAGTGRYYHGDNYHTTGTYDFQITADDTSGNSESHNGQFIITDLIVDQWPPEISDVQANPDPQETGGMVNISAVVTDDVSVGGVWVEIQDPLGAPIGNSSMSFDFLSGRYFFEAVYDALGTYSFELVANDTSGKWNASSGNFVIQDTTSPTLSDIRASPDPQEVSGWVELSANVSDNYQLLSVDVSITDPSGLPLGSFSMSYSPATDRYSLNRTYDVVGTYDFTIVASDTSANSESSPGQFLIVDSTPPTISGSTVMPLTQLPLGFVNISASIHDNYLLSGVWIDIKDPNSSPVGNFTADYNAVNDRHFRNDTYSVVGVYSFCIWANDSSSNWDSYCSNFAIQQTQAPLITDVQNDPAIGEIFQSVNVSAAIFDVDLPLDVWIRITDPLGSVVGNFSMSFDSFFNRYYYATSCDLLGTYSFTIWAGDSTNAWSYADGQFSVEDNTPPTISNVATDPAIREVHGNVNISALVVDNHQISAVSVEVRDPGSMLLGNFSMSYDSIGGRYYHEASYDTLGVHSFCIWARDSFNNWVSSCDGFTIRDSTLPNISNMIADPSPQEVFGTVKISAVVQDNHLIESVSVDVQAPGGQPVGNFSMQYDSISGSYYHETSYSELGTYSFAIYAKDTSGNWGSSSDVFEIVDTTSPVANAGPDQDVGVGGTVTFDGSLSSDNFAVDTYEWTFNDGTGVINLVGAGPQHDFQISGDYLVTLVVTDTSENSGQDTMYVRVSGEKTPSAPTNLLVSETGENYIILTWTAPTKNTDGSDLTDLSSYNIYRSSQSGGPYVKIGALALLSETYRDDGLVPGFSGYYVVTAMNANGRESDHSNEASAEIPEKGSISGSVVDEDGIPIPGASIELKRNGTRTFTIRSDSNGNFTMIDLDDGAYELEISKSGYTMTTVPLVIADGSSVALGSISLDTAPTPPTEDSSLWIILIAVIVVLLIVGIAVVLMIRKRKHVKKKEEEGEDQEE